MGLRLQLQLRRLGTALGNRRRQPRLYGRGHRRRSGSGSGGGGGFAGLAKVAELLDGAVEALETERLAVEEQNGVVFFVLLTATFESDFWFSRLVVVKFYRNPILLRLV